MRPPTCSNMAATDRDEASEPETSVVHAAADLGIVVVDAYNAELRDAEGFIGDRASNRAFRAIIDDLRERVRKMAVDIGGSNIRAGVVELRRKKNADLSSRIVREMELWRYADEGEKPTRDDAINRMVEMLKRLARWAEKHDLVLEPFVGVACPGVI